MSSLVVEILLGLYLGLLTGIVPAVVAGGLGFVFKYITGVTVPGLGVVALAVAIAGVSGGLLGLLDPAVVASPRLVVALVVVMMLSLYAHSQGDRLGTRLPRRFSLRDLGSRTLSTDAIITVGGFGRVEIVPIGDVTDIEGYPPLPGDLRDAIAAERWTFPADVPIEELERRVEERLVAAHQLADVDVSIDDAGRARIAAAPPMGSLSRRVPAGQQAVSIDALIPTGMARGERVNLIVGDRTIEGTVLSARSDPGSAPIVADGGETLPDIAAQAAPTTTGGEGRITVATSPTDAEYLLGNDRARVVVLPRGGSLEYDTVSALREAGNRFRRLTVGYGVAATTVGRLETDTGATILALRHDERPKPSSGAWMIAPDDDRTVVVGDELIAVGRPSAIEAIEGVLA